MSIESFYPYIAVAYGTFGLVFGVALWWKTQRRIDRTRSAIETQVGAAVKDITAKVDEKLGDMPEIDTAPLMARLDALEETLPDSIGTHVAMHYKSIQATEAKSINKALEEMGINFEGAANEARELVEAQLPPEMVAIKKLLTAKIPKALKENNPTWAWLIQQARDAGGGLILSRLQERTGMGVVETAPANSGFGVR